jgi:flagellin
MGSFSILNNIAAINGQIQLAKTNQSLTQSISRLSSGKRINSGADDAAGLMIADTLKANIRAIDQAVRNANDCLSAGQIADSALSEITNLLTRSVSLAEEASTGTTDANGRAALNNEFVQIQAEIARIACQSNFGGVKIFGTGAGSLNGKLDVFVGDMFASSSISVTIHSITADSDAGTVTGLGLDPLTSLPVADLTQVDLTDTTPGAATNNLDVIKQAIIAVANDRGLIGAGLNQLQSAVSVMQSQSLNTQAAESTIRDANMAYEVSNLTKYQILSQTGMAALSQANAQSQSIMNLMQNLG